MRNIDIKMRLAGLFVLLAAMLGASPAGAACWQWSKTAGTNATVDPSINWAEGMSPSSVNDSARAMMARLAECRDDLSGALLTTGTATAYAVTTNQGLNSPPVDGQQIVVRLNLANGVASTLAADGGTAYAIQSAPGTAVASGTLVAGTPYRLTFNLASTAWVLQDFYNAPVAVHSVTYNKIQQVAANRLLGNATGSLADVAEIPLGANLSFVGGALVGGAAPGALPGAIGFVMNNNAGTPNSIVDMVADYFTMITSAGVPFSITTPTGYSVNTSTVGVVNGLDAGSRAADTWYNFFFISNGTTSGGLASLSATAPTMPSGYTYAVRMGAVRTDSSGNFYRTLQRGNRAQYKIVAATNTAAFRNTAIASTGGVYSAFASGAFVPPTARSVQVYMETGVAAGQIHIAANNGMSPSIINAMNRVFVDSAASAGSGAQSDVLLETSDIYIHANAAGLLNWLGWTDKVNAN